ncbi:MAG TPA: DUF4256 domain-containing protein [Ferruginibacter sp.]|nr:DUF4256 domain-containing protein [Ferruginibacter sp.]HRE62972.1 DUF4256 domain-containing protein [Ferruginibacter sp.]
MAPTAKTLSAADKKEILTILKIRFNKNMQRHHAIKWEDVEAKLLATPAKLWSLQQMEFSGGEPDVVDYDKKSGNYIFFDCAPESPKGRRSICYDDVALASRKENKPNDSAMNMAMDMGIELLDEKQYRFLQTLGEFDLKTSSWVKTPESIRKLKGAIFCDRRYNSVFTYHNGAESYYAARGFRGMMSV